MPVFEHAALRIISCLSYLLQLYTSILLIFQHFYHCRQTSLNEKLGLFQQKSSDLDYALDIEQITLLHVVLTQTFGS